jgi:hypothetical protein
MQVSLLPSLLQYRVVNDIARGDYKLEIARLLIFVKDIS